mgnify:CR=1 FL=1
MKPFEYCLYASMRVLNVAEYLIGESDKSPRDGESATLREVSMSTMARFFGEMSWLSRSHWRSVSELPDHRFARARPAGWLSIAIRMRSSELILIFIWRSVLRRSCMVSTAARVSPTSI